MAQFNFRIDDKLKAAMDQADAVDWPSHCRRTIEYKLDEPTGMYLARLLSLRGVALQCGVKESTVLAAIAERVMPAPCRAMPFMASGYNGPFWLADEIDTAIISDLLAYKLINFELTGRFAFDSSETSKLSSEHEKRISKASLIADTYRLNGLQMGKQIR